MVVCVYPTTLFHMSTTNGSEVVVRSEIEEVLEKYVDVFRVPTELPPKRDHDHKIPLVPNAP